MSYSLLNVLTYVRSQQTPMGQIQSDVHIVNKVLLVQRHTHLFTYCLLMLSARTAELNSCNRDLMACKAKNSYYLDLYMKSVLTPGANYLTWYSHHPIQKVRVHEPIAGKYWSQSSNLRHHNSTTCPPVSQGQILEIFFSLESQAQNKPPILSPGAFYDQPSTVII